MFTKILTTDDVTGAMGIKELYLPVPSYELGTLVGFLIPGTKTEEEGVVTGYDIHVSLTKDGTILSQTLYSIDDSKYELMEDEITLSYDEKEWEVHPVDGVV